MRTLLFLVLVSVLVMVDFGEHAGFMGRLALFYPTARAAIARDVEPRAYKLLTWKWGSLAFNPIYLVYDASDTLRLDPGHEPKTFKDKLNTRIGWDDWWPEHLIGHFYVVTTRW